MSFRQGITRWSAGAGFVMGLLLLGGCGGGPPAATPTPTVNPTTATAAPAAAASVASVSLAAEPNPVLVNQQATLVIEADDRDGNGVVGLDLEITATPPDSSGRTITVRGADAGEGHYLANLQPTSTGTWKVVAAANDGRVVRSASVDLSVRPAPTP